MNIYFVQVNQTFGFIEIVFDQTVVECQTGNGAHFTKSNKIVNIFCFKFYSINQNYI